MSISREPQRDYGTSSVSKPFKDDEDGYSVEGHSSMSDSSSEHATAGVKAIEAISQVWTGWSLIAAYTGLLLVANMVSLEQQTTFNLATIVTSDFGHGQLVATIATTASIFYAVVKPIMAKISDVTGRMEAFSIAVFLYVIGYIQMAAAQNIATYASAQLFYAAGSTGLQILQQIFIADTTDLLWRAFFSSLPDLPYLWTVWVGPIIGGSLIAPGGAGWRWGYGIWTIVLPVAFIPLFVALFLNKRKAKNLGYYPRSPYRGVSFVDILKSLWFDLDFFGLLLLTALISLILIPLTIGATAGWANPSIIAMFVVGGLCLIAFPFWERSQTLAPKAFFPRDIFKNRNALVGFSISFFYYMAFPLAVSTYFLTYLLVVQGLSYTAASHVTQIFSFASSITAVLTGLVIRYTAHYKYFITAGACVYTMGYGLMIAYRHEGVSVGSLVGTQIAVGIGGGLLNVPAQLGVQASVNHQQVAAATAIYLTVFEIGGAVGAAIAGAVWTSTALPKLERYLPADTRGKAASILGSVTVATSYEMGSPTREAINRAYQETIHTLLIIAVCISAVVIPLSLCMKNYKLDQIDQKVKGRVIGGNATTIGSSEVDQPSEHAPETLSSSRSRWKLPKLS